LNAKCLPPPPPPLPRLVTTTTAAKDSQPSATSINIPTNVTWSYYLYQLCKYCQYRLDTLLHEYYFDNDILSKFKENATKRLPIKNDVDWDTKIYHQNETKNEMKTNENKDVVFRTILNSSACPSSSSSYNNRSIQTILKYSARYGKCMQIQSTGFLNNKRQWRQFGISVISIAQEVQKWWSCLDKKEKEETTATSTTSTAIPTVESTIPDAGRSSPNGSPFSYRDIMDIAVRWRQVSEPNDPVWWIDLLTKESFSNGFGLQTPLVTGHCHVPRYYPYFKQCFNKMKILILKQMVLTIEQRRNVTNSIDCRTLYNAIGNRDFWVCTTCYRLSEQGGDDETEEEKGEKKKEEEEEETALPLSKLVGVYDQSQKSIHHDKLPIEGTRLTLVEHEPNGYEFTIRMPGLPMRYQQYHQEMVK
jgi:hypothetical protein